MKRFYSTILLLGAFLFFSAIPATAARYALLVGVADYPDVPKLYGPPHDVAALKELLSGRFDIPVAQITTLLDSQATKKNILRALADLKSRTRDGDFIFFYFSGHGTSAFDQDAKLAMGPATGAIVPYDFKEIHGNPQQTLDRLIVGQRDLQPLLLELDRTRTIFAVFDSCYSGNAVRALKTGRGIPKFVPLDIPADTATFSAVKELPFPYRTLVYEAAAHQTEQARDLTAADGTIDNKPHGALTNVLILGLKGEADLNHDGIITYEELHEYVKQKVQAFGHTPQVKSNRSLATPVFERNIAVAPAAPAAAGASASTLRLLIEGKIPPGIIESLVATPGISLVKERPDLRLTASGTQLTLLLASGDPLCVVATVEELRKRLERFSGARELLALKNSTQDFNVFLRPLGDQGKSVFFRGEHLGIEATSEADAHLLLLDIDPQGYVTLLLPNAADDNHVQAHLPFTFADIGEIEPPLGAEYLKLFAFRTPVSGLTPFIGKTLSPVGPEFAQLISLIKRQRRWSATTMTVVTMEK